MRLEFNDDKCSAFEGTYEEWKLIVNEIFPQWTDISTIPMCLGEEMPDRLENWMKYRESGVYLYNSKN